MTALLLLHGLGATGSAWNPLRAVLDWDGPVLSPDLPGHGSAPRIERYGVPDVARALQVSGRLAVLGHSFGGAVGLELASGRYDVDVVSIATVGIKALWPPEDVTRFRALSERPVRTFATREEALERHLAMAGLVGQAPEEHASGILKVEGGWRLALDPRVLAQEDPQLDVLVKEAQAPVLLLRGEHDAMVPVGTAQDLPGLGHNAHVENPAAVWSAAREHLTRS